MEDGLDFSPVSWFPHRAKVAWKLEADASFQVQEIEQTLFASGSDPVVPVRRGRWTQMRDP